MWADQTDIDCDSVISPNLYELGDSLEEWAHGALDLADSGPLVVVGNSVGASCAIEMALLASDRVAGLVLMGAKAGHRPEPDARDEAIRLLNEEGISAAWKVHWAPLFGARADADVVEAARQIAFDQTVADLVRGTLVFHTRQDRSHFVHEWKKPLMVISGDQDRPERARAMARSSSSGEFHLVRSAGHYVSLEKPTETHAILEHAVRIIRQRP